MCPMYSVLYVDDDQLLLDLCRSYLEKSGDFRIEITNSAPDAIEKIKNTSYDAIVSDYQMPEMDGIEFLKKVRESGNSIPFIIFTGKGREEVVIEAINSGADSYIQKGGDPKAQFAELAHKIRQIVRRSRAEQTLKESEVRYRAIFQNTSDIIWVLDREGRSIYTSPSSERILGYLDGSLVGKDPLEFIHPKDRDRIKADLSAVYEKKNTGTPSEYRIRAVNGEYLWVESIAVNLIGILGVDGLVLTTRPITERKREEEALRKTHESLHDAFEQLIVTEEELRLNYEELARSEQQLAESERKVQKSETFFTRVISDACEGITVFDHELRYILWNKFMENLTGIPATEVLGKRAIEKFPFLKEVGVDHLLKQALSGKAVESSDLSFHIPQSGKQRWVRAIYSTLYDTDGTIIGVIGIIQDITERKAMEHALQTTIDQLMESEEKYRNVSKLSNRTAFQRTDQNANDT
jgi:PAS domain S-box-containing protein